MLNFIPKSGSKYMPKSDKTNYKSSYIIHHHTSSYIIRHHTRSISVGINWQLSKSICSEQEKMQVLFRINSGLL